MGGSKSGNTSSTNQSGSSSQTRQLTEEERALQGLDLSLRQKTDPYLGEMQVSGLQLGNQLLQGNTPLPGWMKGIEGGISPEITDSIVNQSLRDVDTRMAGQGLIDSGTRASLISRTSGDIRRASEEFNIGNKLNLMNLALTGQAQVQAPILGNSQSLGNRMTTTGTTTKNYYGQQNSQSQSSSGGGGFSFF